VLRWLPNDWVPGTPPLIFRTDALDPALVAATEAVTDRLASHFGGQVAKLMFASLRPGGSISPHHDAPPALTMVHRCHLPVVTNPDASFSVDGQDYRLEAGMIYELDNIRAHGVENRGTTARVHLICDILPD
jgi:aspartyl/asparaginyl beta-hydroxylase (cupin superfamily)